MEDKPWRMPGADITGKFLIYQKNILSNKIFNCSDYFNYGFNEDTWRAYCEKQKRLRVTESGVGLVGIGAGAPNNTGSVVKVKFLFKLSGNC
jgi:pre-mRNA 3'-end-processing factor FIP1